MSVVQISRVVIAAAKRVTLTTTLVMIWITAENSPGSEVQIIAPEGFSDTEGNVSAGGKADTFRIQYLYAASDFASLPSGKNTIIWSSSRLDGAQNSTFTQSSSDLRVTVATTTQTDLNTEFASNLGDDAIVVFDGPVTQTRPATGPPSGPHPFGTGIQFHTPFKYDPTQGRNLVVEFLSSVPPDVGAETDFQNVSYRGTVFSSNPDDDFGSRFAAVQVRAFQFVPEPSTVIMAAFVVLGLAVIKQRTGARTANTQSVPTNHRLSDA